MKEKPALFGGQPVRGPENPLPSVFPRTLSPRCWELIQEVLKAGLGSGHMGRFEQTFAQACGVKYGIAVTNCTSAVHAALAAAGVGPGDEVITTPVTDYGTVMGIWAQQAKAVLADVEPRTGNLTAETIEPHITDRTRAIVIVHLWGQPCEMEPIVALARKRGVILIEDACQSPLAKYRGRPVGSFGDLGCFSFDHEKHLTTECGGMVVTDNEELAQGARVFAHGRGAIPSEIEGLAGRSHLVLGNNYRYTSLQAAVGLAQLELLPDQNKRRTEKAALLSRLLEKVPGVEGPPLVPDAEHVFWQYPLWLRLEEMGGSPKGISVADFARALRAEGIPALPRKYLLVYDYPLVSEPGEPARKRGVGLRRHEVPGAFQYRPGMCPGAELHLSHCLPVEWHDRFSDEDIADIAKAVEKVAAWYGTCRGAT